MSHDEGNEDLREDGNMKEVSDHSGVHIYYECIAKDNDDGHDPNDG
jgi:hypothetical protein